MTTETLLKAHTHLYVYIYICTYICLFLFVFVSVFVCMFVSIPASSGQCAPVKQGSLVINAFSEEGAAFFSAASLLGRATLNCLGSGSSARLLHTSLLNLYRGLELMMGGLGCSW